MRVALIYGDWCLSFRGAWDFRDLWHDPRGMSGSELAFVRIAQELVKLGHEVTLFTTAGHIDASGNKVQQKDFNGIPVKPLAERVDFDGDVALVLNEPELLRDCTKVKVRACEQYLNSFEYCRLGFDSHVDLWLSPSDSHRDMILGMKHEHDLRIDGSPRGYYEPDPAKWVTVPLGCDPERYGNAPKVSGRVVYCSSPDRGLHLLLQEWPKIKKAAPHASLRIFYRLKPWLDDMHNMRYNPAVEPLRARGYYIEECLRRMPDMGIEICDSVSRERIEQEMSAAESLAYPCDTIRYSEGFSCTILECCAARACPVIFDTDALGSIYGNACAVVPRGDMGAWSDTIIRALQDSEFREATNRTARALAEELTWQKRTKTLESVLLSRMG